MKENTIKLLTATAIGGVAAYFHGLAIPLVVLLIAVCVDYATGLIKAYYAAELSSKIGFKGIVKKISYFVVVAVGMGVDWLIEYALGKGGITYSGVFAIAIIVIIWLVINEMISILENLAAIGVPIPKFLIKIIGKLKNQTENKANTEDNGDDDKEDDNG